VLTNLISNDIKHNDKENGEVHLYYEEHPAHYEFFIRDNGPGIAEDYHRRIFEIFQILKERDSFESTGIGLTVVKKILDGRGEQVKVHSELGKGATFSFTWSK
jgi:light-regulated signal transduction histidine kinase (bacteriophytochrome)